MTVGSLEKECTVKGKEMIVVIKLLIASTKWDD